MTDPTWSPPPPEFTSDPLLTLPVAWTKPFTFAGGVGAELGWGSGVGGVDGADGTELNVPDAVAEAVALASTATCAASGAVLSGRSDSVFFVAVVSASAVACTAPLGSGASICVDASVEKLLWCVAARPKPVAPTVAASINRKAVLVIMEIMSCSFGCTARCPGDVLWGWTSDPRWATRSCKRNPAAKGYGLSEKTWLYASTSLRKDLQDSYKESVNLGFVHPTRTSSPDGRDREHPDEGLATDVELADEFAVHRTSTQ